MQAPGKDYHGLVIIAVSEIVVGETVLKQLYDLWLYAGVPVIVGLTILLWKLITAFITFVRSSTLVRVGLAARQEINFEFSGHVVLAVEGPRWTARFRSLEFELRSPEGMALAGRSQLMRERVTTIRRTRLSLIEYNLPSAGRYILSIHDRVGPRVDDADHSVLFLKPRPGEMVARILSIIVTTDLLVAAIVFFVLRTS